MSNTKTPHGAGVQASVVNLCMLALALNQLSTPQCWGQTSQHIPARDHLIVVVGAGGTDTYEREFERWGVAWKKLAEHQQWKLTMIDGQDESVSCRSQLQTALSEQVTAEQVTAERGDSTTRLWIVLLGHGTSSGDNSKFNLVGPDVSAKELSAWLEPLEGPLVIINCSSASAPFLTELSAPQRMVLTATRSGSELNYSRFGKYLSQSLEDLTADIDHDLEVSLLEAFLAAVARTEQFYRDETRLATEHALLDDNGDQRGSGGEFFRGIRPVKTGEKGQAVDGQLAARLILFSSPEAPQLTPAQTLERQRIETQLDALRADKPNLDEQVYFQRLEQLLLNLSAVYDAAE